MEQKTNLPGIFLMIVGVLSLLWALAYTAINILQAEGPQFADARMTLGTGGVIAVIAVIGVLFLLESVLVLIAGMKLRNLRSYGLVMTGTILAMIPCCTTPGCCLLGLPIGIWSLVVLMDPQVKAAFR